MRMNTEKYEFSHGKKPRGSGHWLFAITGSDGCGRYITELRKSSGTLSLARKQAIYSFRSEIGSVKEIIEVEVMP